MAKLTKMLNAELSKAGEGKQVRLTTSTKEGIAADMDHVMKALKDVRWDTAPEPAGE